MHLNILYAIDIPSNISYTIGICLNILYAIDMLLNISYANGMLLNTLYSIVMNKIYFKWNDIYDSISNKMISINSCIYALHLDIKVVWIIIYHHGYIGCLFSFVGHPIII